MLLVCGLHISVDSILSRRVGPTQGGASWWSEGGPFWSSHGGERVNAMGDWREAVAWEESGESAAGGAGGGGGGSGGGEPEDEVEGVAEVVVMVVVVVVATLVPICPMRFSKAWFFCSVST